MKIKSIVILLTFLLLLSGLSIPAIACDCEGDPPGNPSCYTCEDGVWVLAGWAQCGQASDCTGECHNGCSNYCLCQGDQSRCTGCESCWTFTGNCLDDDSQCTAECDNCLNGECVDFDPACTAPCDSCIDGTCQDDHSKCYGCESCQSGSCVDDSSICYGCQSCNSGVCEDDNSNCNAANCETCINTQCTVCGGDTSLNCCPDQSCVKPCELQADNPCNTSQDYECIFCSGTPPACAEMFNARVYTGNTRYYCREWGCTGDCVRDDDVLCYTEYDCYGAWLQGLCALDPFTNTLFCYISDPTVPDNACARCAKDLDDPGEPSVVWSYKCL